MLFKSRLIFGIFKSMFGAVFGVLYKLISLFNLQFTALTLLIGIVLYFTGVFEQSSAFKTIYQLLIVLSAVYAIIATIKKLLRLDNKVKKSKGAQIKTLSSEEKNERKEERIEELPRVKEQENKEEKPRYFRIKKNPNFVMAEYSDRYELYKIEGGRLIKIRSDYK